MKNSLLVLWQSDVVAFNNIIHLFKFKVGFDGSKLMVHRLPPQK